MQTNSQQIKQSNKKRQSYNQLTDDEKKIYWENFRSMVKSNLETEEKRNSSGVQEEI